MLYLSNVVLETKSKWNEKFLPNPNIIRFFDNLLPPVERVESSLHSLMMPSFSITTKLQ